MHLAARNPEQEKLEAEKRAEEMAKLRYVHLRNICYTTVALVLLGSHAGRHL